MIPAIGTMIGFYILLRCFSFLERKGDRAESWGTKTFAVITILVTLGSMASMCTGSGNTP